MDEKAEKIANKQQKREDFQAWREERRVENEAAREQRKQEKKERKAAAKAAKELRRVDHSVYRTPTYRSFSGAEIGETSARCRE
jgi:hypothetical protein